MERTTERERFQPCLLDRLVDNHPTEKTETVTRRAIPLSVFRASVLRDLSWLLNCCCKPEDEPIYGYTEAAQSVLNYGMMDLCGATRAELTAHEVEQHLRDVIKLFEPRILPDSIVVKVSEQVYSGDRTLLSFQIEGELWAVPYPEQFLARTQVDLETGHAEVLT